MKILAGTDFSPNAADAVAAAAALARRFNDSLELVHATLPPISEGLPAEIWTPVEEQLRAQLQAEAEKLKAQGVKTGAAVELGSADEVLRRLAHPGTTRMVVVSSVGRVALARVLLGSAAERIAERVPVPTLVVRSAAPFQDWAAGRHLLRIFVAADFSTTSEAALAAARELADHGPCEITVGYTDRPDAEADRMGLRPGGKSPGNPPALQAALKRDLQDKVSALLAGHRVALRVEPQAGSAAATLIEMAKSVRADVLITGTHQHHGLSRLWHRSTSRALLGDAPMSVLCAPFSNRTLSRSRIPPLNRVLVTTDFSALGNRAVAAACALLPNGGRLRLLHVVAPEQSPVTLLGGHPKKSNLSPGEHARLVQNARRKLGSLLPADAVAHGIEAEVVVEIAEDVAGTVLQQAEQFGAHAICLSSHGRSGVTRALLGSVAGAILQRSHRPVHIVREPVK